MLVLLACIEIKEKGDRLEKEKRGQIYFLGISTFSSTISDLQSKKLYFFFGSEAAVMRLFILADG
ncbi:MAG: hypothetical protein OEY45_05570, partial [Gammaproteobacteria bacterium]|nr:hypothetical protein [Gammaproteobacteria bacterium]